MEEIKKSARRIAESLDCLLYYNPEDLNKQYEKELREKLKEEVRNEVKEEDRINIAKKMLKFGDDEDYISKVTELSLEEIKKLK